MAAVVAPDAADLEALLEACRQATAEGRHGEGLPMATALQDRVAPNAPVWCEAGLLRALNALRLGELALCLQVGKAVLAALDTQGARADLGVRIQVLNVMVLACEQSGRFPDALQLADQSWRLAQQSGSAVHQSWALNRLGSVHRDLGDEAAGRAMLERALGFARQAGHRQAEFAALNNLGSQLNWRALACDVQGAAVSASQALDHLREAWAVAQHLDNHSSRAICLTNLAWALRETGDVQAAADAAGQALQLADTHGLRQVRMHSRIEAALTRLAQGDAAQAARWLDEAAPLHNADDRWGALALERARCAVCQAQGRFEEALQAHQRYHALAVDETRIRSNLHLEVLRREHALELAEIKSRRAGLEAEMQRLRAEQLRRQAHEDALTGLYNRHFVDEQLPVLRQRARDRERPLMALLCDADHFKTVNDSFGHRVGDQVLRQIGLLLLHSTRVSDLAARWGGEEMLLLMPDTAPRLALEAAERLRRQVQAQPWDELAPGLRVTLSIGVAAVPPEGDPLGAADAALYLAKRSGRNRVMPDPLLEGLK